MLKSKQDIENAIELHARELAHYDDPECYNAAWCDGYIYAMKEIIHDMFPDKSDDEDKDD